MKFKESVTNSIPHDIGLFISVYDPKNKGRIRAQVAENILLTAMQETWKIKVSKGTNNYTSAAR